MSEPAIPACAAECGTPLHFFETLDDGSERVSPAGSHHAEHCPRARWLVEQARAGRFNEARRAMLDEQRNPR